MRSRPRPANQELLHAKSAEKLGIKWKNPGVKKNKNGRIDQKAAIRGYNGVIDLTRASFVTDTPEHALSVVQMLRKSFSVIDEGWRITPVGYMDRSLMVRFPNGGIGQV